MSNSCSVMNFWKICSPKLCSCFKLLRYLPPCCYQIHDRIKYRYVLGKVML
uniref:Uncharacterized protein n=1 Tax=Rhizophora mucronata TaxID=61149 RepID=A0A2P2Q1B8_RHIMU